MKRHLLYLLSVGTTKNTATSQPFVYFSHTVLFNRFFLRQSPTSDSLSLHARSEGKVPI